MIYLFMSYIIFQVIYDNWIPDSANWHSYYFGFQFLWVAALSFVQAFKSSHYLFYYICALIMLITAICKFLQLNTTAIELSKTPPGIAWFDFVIVAALLLILLIDTQWEKLKKTGRGFYF